MEVDDGSSDEGERMPIDDEGLRIDGIYIPPPREPMSTLNSTDSRLMITKITNNFFKSYATDTVLGPFHKCFNAIVGPNGSGKSNVIDSLLFVFGYKASRIRCKKVSVLLHNSESFRNVQSCNVAVHFAEIIDKEGDDYEILPGSQFVIARTAHKDNSSFYELNGKRVQFKEVALLLRKHGIDLDHNRFLILQGEVEQISLMKCKGDKDGESGMLEYLEDIIGTSRYKESLEQLHERLEYLTDHRTEKLNRLKMAENEVEELRQPMEEAVSFLKMENTIMKNKNFLYQKSIKDVKGKIEVEEKSREEVFEVQKCYSDKLKALEKQKREHTEAHNKESKVYENLKSKKDGIQETVDRAQRKDMQLQENMTNMNKTRKKTKEKIAEEKHLLEKLENVPEENAKNIEDIDAKVKATLAKKEQLEAEKTEIVKNIQRETQGQQAQKEELQKDLAVLKEAVDKTKSAFNLAETELKVCIGNEENEKNKLEQLEQLLETSKQTIQERTKQVTELNKKIPATKKALNEANVELLQVKQEEATLINTIRTQRANLEEGKSSMQATKSSSRVLDSLMQAKREGKCSGLFGRLGDLGAIDAVYDVAVSTACGPLDNIVVDTVDCAQWCIEYLKKHDIGRAVFIALEKQEHLRQQANSQINTPENVHRLYDLIRVQDERVKTAFYYALRDTLVANDLDQASRIAYGARRYRVVTLKGDLIETTGTMSGGGKRMLRGRMGQSVAVCNVDPRQLKRLENEVQEMELRVRELRQRQNALESQISELQPALRQMQIDLEKFTKELHSLQQQQPNLIRQVKEQTARAKNTKSDEQQVNRLTAIVERRRQEYDTANETAGELQVKVDQLTKEIRDKGAGKVRSVEKQIKECTKIIDVCKSETTKLKVAVKTAEKKYATTKENIARMQQEVENMEANLQTMKAEREEIEADTNKLLTCLVEINEQLLEREEVFTEARKVIEGLTKEQTKLKSEKIDVDEKLKGHDKKLKEYTSTVNGWKSKLGQLKLLEIPNETVEELKQFTDEELEEQNVENAEKEIQAAEKHLKAAKPNLNAIQQYREKHGIYMKRNKDVEEITIKRSEVRRVYDDLRNRRKDEFTAGYNIIKLKLKELYQMITLGGDAALEMVDTYDPFTEGIQFNVRPPRKTWKKISNLSGGEKTLSSLALVFALHYYKPSPLYVMDEIDAALDFRNVSIVGNYIKERTTNAQFIIISLRSNMFELCDHLVGIYKTYNTTKSITINPNLGDKQAPAPSDNVMDSQPVIDSRADLSNNTRNISNEEPANDKDNQESKGNDQASNKEPANDKENQESQNDKENQESQNDKENQESQNDKESQESEGNDQASLNDSGESGMVTTDSHLDDEEDLVGSSPEENNMC